MTFPSTRLNELDNILTEELIDKFIEDGVLVIPNVLLKEEILYYRNSLHNTLLNYGIDINNLIDTAGNLSKLSSTQGAGGILDIYYTEWKLKLLEHPLIASIMMKIFDRTYGSNSIEDNDEDSENNDEDNDNDIIDFNKILNKEINKINKKLNQNENESTLKTIESFQKTDELVQNVDKSTLKSNELVQNENESTVKTNELVNNYNISSTNNDKLLSNENEKVQNENESFQKSNELLIKNNEFINKIKKKYIKKLFLNPFESFHSNELYSFIDRFCFRLPDNISKLYGKNDNKPLHRSLSPHLDCCPSTLLYLNNKNNKINYRINNKLNGKDEDLNEKDENLNEKDEETTEKLNEKLLNEYELKSLKKWRPIQCFIALTSSNQINMGGFEAIKGTHKIFNQWINNRLNEQNNIELNKNNEIIQLENDIKQIEIYINNYKNYINNNKINKKNNTNNINNNHNNSDNSHNNDDNNHNNDDNNHNNENNSHNNDDNSQDIEIINNNNENNNHNNENNNNNNQYNSINYKKNIIKLQNLKQKLLKLKTNKLKSISSNLCIGQYTALTPNFQYDKLLINKIEPILYNEGDLIIWDHRIPHASSRHNNQTYTESFPLSSNNDTTSSSSSSSSSSSTISESSSSLQVVPREVVYLGYLPNISLNREYMKKQLDAFNTKGTIPDNRGQWEKSSDQKDNNILEKSLELYDPRNYNFTTLGKKLMSIDPW